MQYLSQTYYGNTLVEWATAFGIIVVAFLVGKAIYFVLNKFGKKITQKSDTRIDDIILDMIEEPLVFAVVLFGISISLTVLNLPSKLEVYIAHGYNAMLILAFTWLLARLFNAVADEYLAPLVRDSEGELDDQLFPILKKGVKLSIWTLGIIAALNNAGYDVGSILAGLGIGGLAFALAAQDTVSNLFGGFTIFTDRPFIINDRIQVNGFDGSVKEVGLRSTRITTLEGRTVTMPNKLFTTSPVINVSSEPSRKVVLNLGMTYDTTHEQMQEAMNTFKSIATEHEGTQENVLVGFNNFGDFSLGIVGIYYIKKEADILQTQTDINLQILKQFNEKKLEMAFPTQTVYMAKD